MVLLGAETIVQQNCCCRARLEADAQALFAHSHGSQTSRGEFAHGEGQDGRGGWKISRFQTRLLLIPLQLSVRTDQRFCKSLRDLAPRAGFEPATLRLTGED